MNDLFKADDIQNGLAVVGRGMAENYGVRVNWHGGTEMSADIHEKIVNIPRLACASGISDEALNVVRFGTGHEFGHIAKTKLTKAETPEGALFRIFNAVEDVRMEHAVAKDYPGYREIFAHHRLTANMRIAGQVLAGEQVSPLWESTVACMFQCDGLRPAWTLSDQAKKYFDAIYDTFIKVHSCDLTDSVTGTRQALELAKEMFAILKKLKKEEELNEEAKKGEPGEQGEKGEKGEKQEKDDKGQGQKQNGKPEQGNEDSKSQPGEDEDGSAGDDEGEEDGNGAGSGDDDLDGEEDGKGQGGKGEGEEGDDDKDGEADGKGQGEADDKDGEKDGQGQGEGQGDDKDGEADGQGKGEGNGEGEEPEADGEGEGLGGEGEPDGGSKSAGDKDNGKYKPSGQAASYVPKTDAEIEAELDEESKGKTLTDVGNEVLAEELKVLEGTVKYLARRDLDQHVVAPLGPKDADAYQTILRKSQSDVMAMTWALEQAMRARSACRKSQFLRTGKVDMRRLVPIAKALSKEVFCKVTPGEKLSTAVEIVIDESGSMGKSHKQVMVLAMVVGECLSRLNIPFEIVGTTTAGSPPPLDGFTRTNPIIFRHFKVFSEGWNAVRGRMVHLYKYANNIDGEAVEYAGSRLLARPETRKIVFSLSDGRPDGGQDNESALAQNIKDVCKRLRKSGVEVYSFGIQTDLPMQFYGKQWFLRLDSAVGMGQAFIRKFADIITAGKMSLGTGK